MFVHGARKDRRIGQIGVVAVILGILRAAQHDNRVERGVGWRQRVALVGTQGDGLNAGGLEGFADHAQMTVRVELQDQDFGHGRLVSLSGPTGQDGNRAHVDGSGQPCVDCMGTVHVQHL
jgi:hypothetical protein